MKWKINIGILQAFILLVALVAIVGALFFTQYIYGIVLGTVFQATANFTTTGDVVNNSFTANLTNAQSLSNGNISTGTLAIFNQSDNVQLGLANFTVDLIAGTVQLANNDHIPNGTALGANYSFAQPNPGSVQVTGGTRNFLTSNENSYISTAGFINSGSLFAGGLIVVAIVLVVFAGILQLGKKPKGGKGMDY